MTCEVHTQLWHDGQSKGSFPLDQLGEELDRPGSLVWADLLDPAPDDVEKLASELGLDKHTVEDALTFSERPKAVRYRTYLFITAFTVVGTAQDGQTHRVSLIVLPHGIVTVRLGGTFPMRDLSSTIDDDSEMLVRGPKALLHAILDAIVDGYFDVVTSIDAQVDDLEDELFVAQHAGNAIARQAYQLHKDVSRLRRVVLPMREVISTILRHVSTDPHERDLIPDYEDLYDHIVQAADWSDSLRDSVESIQDTNVALGDAQLNQVMKKLTAWAAIVAVPTAITGWYGQNVPYPGYSKEWGFYVSTAVILGLGLTLYLSFKRRNWL